MLTYFPCKVIAQYITQSYIECPNSPYALMSNNVPNVDVRINIEARPLGNKTYESKMCVDFEAIQVSAVDANNEQASNEQDNEIVCFSGTVKYCAAVSIEEDNEVSDNDIEPTVMIKIPELLFPFVRQIVAELVQKSGFNPLLINPIDFEEMYLQNKDKLLENKDNEE